MKVLVSAASRHGATAGIARAIAETLTEAGLEAVALPPDAVTTLDGYDAAVLGSGIYVGHWMDSARQLVERHAAALASRLTSPRSWRRRTPASTGSLPARWTRPRWASAKR